METGCLLHMSVESGAGRPWVQDLDSRALRKAEAGGWWQSLRCLEWAEGDLGHVRQEGPAGARRGRR